MINDFFKNFTKQQELLFKKKIVNNWDYNTVYYLKNKELTQKKLNEYKQAKNKERWLLNRNIYQYIDSIIKGWFVEDYIYDILEKNKIKYERIGADKRRELLFDKNMFEKIKGEFDCIIENNYCDIVSDYTKYCQKNNSISLNFEKFNKMKNKNALLLIYDVKNNRVILLNPNIDIYKYKNIKINNIKNAYKKECFYNYKKHSYDINYFRQNIKKILKNKAPI